jgi:hypothetical protein
MTFRKNPPSALPASTTPITRTLPTSITRTLPTPITRALAILVILPLLLPSCTLPDKPVTQKEALDLAAKIERSVDAHNEALLNDIFDQKRFAQRVLDSAHQRFNISIAKGAQEGLAEARWGHQIVTNTRDGGGYSLVHQYEKDGHQHLLFRLFEGSSAINYHDFELVKTDQGVKAVDVYIYLSGQTLSKTIAQSILLMTDKVADMNPDDQSKVEHMRRINELIQSGNSRDAGQYFDQLPESLKKEKLFQLIHLRIEQNLNDSAYVAALNEYKASFPRDPNLGLIMLDAYIMEKDYTSALGAVNSLDSALHLDPFLDYYRALIDKLKEEPTQSRFYLERLHHNMPRFGKGTVELLANYANAGYPDSAADLVRQAQADKNITADQIQRLEQAYPTIKPYLKKVKP